MNKLILPAVLLIVMSASLVEAAKVKVWHHQTPSHYEKAKLQQTTISNEGAIRLSKQMKKYADIDATHVWDMLEDAEGNLYLATGDQGKIIKVTPEGKTSVVYTSEDSQVFCLVLSGTGSIFAGTGPSGKIIEINAKGEAKVFCDTGESYVWSLTLDPAGQTLYAGTGPKGRILKVNSEGKASTFCTTKQEHVLCVASAPDGTLFAGTDKDGLVYKIDAKGKAFVLFNAPQSEIRTMRIVDNALYVGTSAPTSKRGGGNTTAETSSSSDSSGSGKGGGSPVTVTKEKPVKVSEGSGVSASDSREPSKGSPASAPTPPSSGENSLYRVTFDGVVREIFREKAMILCQLPHTQKFPRKCLLGTGLSGQLFEVDVMTREKSELVRLDHGQVLCMSRRKDGSIVVGTGDPGKLYVLQDRYTEKGTVLSDVLDAKLGSKWGSLRWRSEAPEGSAVTVAVRSGNTSEPDETWSDWSAEQKDSENAVVSAPSARYLQYRLTLSSDKPDITPVLRSLTIRYSSNNLAPDFTSLDTPDIDSTNQENPKRLKFKWNAVDPNEDELTYNVYVRKEGWKEWVLLEEGLEKKEFEWETTTTPTGNYQLKVSASDRRDNLAEETLTAEKISTSFSVSHTPPTVTVKMVGMDGDQAILEATAVDDHVRLIGAFYSLNGKKWVPLQPSDGIFDGKSESFRFKTDSLKPGAYVLVLRVRDAAANTGSGDAVFTVEKK